jgi:hypothetical protein
MYLGNTPTQQAFTPAVDVFSGNGSTTAFTLSRPVASVAQVQAFIENVPQSPVDAFTVSGNAITFTSAPPSGSSNIYVRYTSPITQVMQPSDGAVGTGQLAAGAVNSAKMAPGAARANFGAGAVLQVVSASSNTITSTSSASYVSTGFSASITPTSNTSKIIVLLSVPCASSVTSGQNIITIYRGATDLSIAGGSQRGFGEMYSNAGQLQSHISACYLDSPATISSTTYTVYQASTNAAGSVQICQNNTTASITLMEIAA